MCKGVENRLLLGNADEMNLVVRWCYALGSTIRLFHICFTLFYEHRFIHCAIE